MGFNSGFKGLREGSLYLWIDSRINCI